MRTRFALLLVLLAPSVAAAQTADIVAEIDRKIATLRFVRSLEVPTGGFRADATAKEPGLRATTAAFRAWKYTATVPGAPFQNADKHAAFVMKCYDPKTGGFADAPGGPVSVPLTAVGVMAAMELDVPRAKFAKALDYLKDNAKTFEDVRLGAAAVEAWRVADCPFDLAPWFKTADGMPKAEFANPQDGGARQLGSVAAFRLRLGAKLDDPLAVVEALRAGQRKDGGYGKTGAERSDLDSTYRVMRALHLLKYSPADSAALRGFVASCRNADGGYGVAPGQPSSAGGTYYAAIITHWLGK